MTKSCPVLGCKSIRAKGSLHFFRFPKVSKKFGDIGRVSLRNLCFLFRNFVLSVLRSSYTCRLCLETNYKINFKN